MNNFQILFEMENNISWDGFLFWAMLLVVVLIFLVATIRSKSKNEGSILKTLIGFIFILYMIGASMFFEYQQNMRDDKVWLRYKKGDYQTVVGKVQSYQEGYKNKKHYDHFIVKDIRFNGVYASPNPTNFDDKIFYYHKEILEENLTVRISYINNIKGMLGNAIVKFEVQKSRKE